MEAFTRSASFRPQEGFSQERRAEKRGREAVSEWVTLWELQSSLQQHPGCFERSQKVQAEDLPCLTASVTLTNMSPAHSLRVRKLEFRRVR